MRGLWRAALYKNHTAPQLKRVYLLSVRPETPEGDVVLRKSAHVSGQLVKRPAVDVGGKRTFVFIVHPSAFVARISII